MMEYCDPLLYVLQFVMLTKRMQEIQIGMSEMGSYVARTTGSKALSKSWSQKPMKR